MYVLPRTSGGGPSAEFIARLRAVEAGDGVAPTRDAATVVLLRDAAGGGIEAYLLRRVPTMAFAAGMHVFPGGGVDPRDADHQLASSGPAAGRWAGALSADEPLARALVAAAVRETFEECGVLLAGSRRDPDTVVADMSDPSWEVDRQELLDKSLSLTALLERRGLVLRADMLHPWSHWITPEVEPTRYDTRFFVAALPPGQRTRDVGGEADRVVWMRPGDAVERYRDGSLAMLPPTATILAELAPHNRVSEVLAAAPGRDIRPVLPRVVIRGEDAAVLLPDDPGYDA